MEDEGAMMAAEEEKPQVGMKKKAHKKRKKLLYETIRKQLEFYFSDANLTRDRFLGKLIQDDPNVPLEVFMRFNKVIAVASSVDELAKALEGSEILQVSEDKRTVKRVAELQPKTNVDECTIYIENVPSDVTHDYITNIFSEYGKVVYVSLPKFHGTHVNKGFAFLEFDTPEEANKALQVFWDKGCCLPTHMPPEKLCSIRTHESNKDNLQRSIPESNIDKESTAQPEGKENIMTDSKKKRKLEADDESPQEAKIKKESKDSALEEETKREESKSSKKRKVKEEEQNSNEGETEERISKKIKIEEDKSVLDTDESTQAESGVTESKKRHRKKKKKTKEDKNEVFADGLLILSKKEWKRLRNKYLDMQKHKMNQVKARLRQAQSYYHKYRNDDNMKNKSPGVKAEEKEAKTESETGRVKQSPGVIVKVTFDEPLSCATTFKNEAKKHSSVKYIDATAGNWEAYLRCATASDATSLVETQPWSQMSVLQGDEEEAYWGKIKKDRAEKVNNKSLGRSKERGKKKLLRKAEKMRGTHLLFN